MTIQYSLSDLSDIAKQIISNIEHRIVLFNAPMGVGKTTLIKEICKQLGIEDIISSPTYSLVNEYKNNDLLVYHFDFYRIKDEIEAYDIGFEEYLTSDAWIFIEWPDKVLNLLPENVTTIAIELSEDEKRILTLK
ncbi:tRNA (adenosine(37)-N6)-threonylcarbamoyltransferase complex ATPase subunit type 1 TsaE [Aquimarina algicola]|uniref:tRNA threonylcarbamoyladenosine biosynthesis protein TsaE n=1 Tax=Aquimarina algicola TaxID=2589995 RepID=A0A504JDI1_9FLAO|nr:tRNA (adenosine(37)-N6)-threonylcarbamoyltransferase complex ATPase subunit type 1 TsaE [Aquimarina algicola]TPN88774.1 tRNA (adenosine(37)-N6)-threonylcarbamoyltransferase complex ATPase subunit type 1 TsaE [Aquimarina algicola]